MASFEVDASCLMIGLFNSRVVVGGQDILFDKSMYLELKKRSVMRTRVAYRLPHRIKGYSDSDVSVLRT